MAVFDTQFLVYLFDENVNPPIDQETGDAIPRFKDRVSHLVEELDRTGELIVIPTPVLSEYLEGAGVAGPQRLEEIQNEAAFSIADFDTRAAVEQARLSQEYNESLPRNSPEPRQKVKFDRQIIAVARVCAETLLFSGDKGLKGFARKCGDEGQRLRGSSAAVMW